LEDNMVIQLWLVTALLYILLPVLLDVLREQPVAATGIVVAVPAVGLAPIAAAATVSVMQLVLD
jgi:hypothetical protein